MVGYNYIRQENIIIILPYYRFIINYYIVIASYCILIKLRLIIKLKLTNVCLPPLNFLSSSATEHRTTFANVLEGCLIHKFCIYRFCRTVQFLGENRGQQRVDRLEISSVALQSAAGATDALPAWPCAALASASVRTQPTTSRLEPPVSFASVT
jgi:hypothetical protein